VALAILLGFVLAGIVGFTANQILWRHGLGPIRSFFKPQSVVHHTKKSPFQMFVGCLGGMATLIGFGLGILWLAGVLLGVYPAFLAPVATILTFAGSDSAGLLLAALIVLLIGLGLMASSKEDKKE